MLLIVKSGSVYTERQRHPSWSDSIVFNESSVIAALMLTLGVNGPLGSEKEAALAYMCTNVEQQRTTSVILFILKIPNTDTQC